jgi:uncharacterized protein YbbC (DUF1343 family)
MASPRCRTGLDRFERACPKRWRGARAGLVCHPASVDASLEHASIRLLRSDRVRLRALFGPQHGILGQTQDNMVEWEGFRDPATGLPAHSLYGEVRKPRPEWLHGLDLLVVDLQDVGSRYYTFIWTLALCIEACEERGIGVLVLDRPNPVGGALVEGPVLDPAYASFVGWRPLPVRHGMTVAEIAVYLRERYHPSLDLEVVPMEGWRRAHGFERTGLPWVMPSPNMPSPETALVYPGMCLLEATNLSEGRGTTRPFEFFGAPFADPRAVARRLEAFRLPGVRFRPASFQPTFQKWAGRLCHGAQLHVTDPRAFRPFATGVAVLAAFRELYPEGFAWKRPPYEYETVKPPIDILAGSARLRLGLEAGRPLEAMREEWAAEVRAFAPIRREALLY